jgi:type II secretory pathway pseudopilin PulG
MRSRLRPTSRNAAFTFVEILAALLFLALVVPAIVGALGVANRASVAAERSALAGELAQNKLNEFLVGDTWQNPPFTNGDFEGAYPGYRWEMTQESWTGDPVNTGMTALHVDVHYTVQGEDRTVRLSTLVYAATATSTTGSGTTGTSTTTGSTP